MLTPIQAATLNIESLIPFRVTGFLSPKKWAQGILEEAVSVHGTHSWVLPATCQQLRHIATAIATIQAQAVRSLMKGETLAVARIWVVERAGKGLQP
ncbi:MAG: hypothetical protein HOC23_07805 [Halieaceae bacterium]|nr:hypothetical protein [Halieaceae bacterium]